MSAPTLVAETDAPGRDPEILPVILAGGAGTRFWPLSTEARPKQFLRLFGEKSLLEMSFERALALAPAERILVLTSERFRELVREQLPELPEENLVGEPLRRDTAAAIALAALLARRRHGDPTMVVLTSDHLITPVERFVETIASAARAASAGAGEGVLYTIGIVPAYPATGYGYLERGEPVLDDGGIVHYALRGFREKPDAATAERFLASGGYDWNSGMFVWTVGAILAELDRHLPGHARTLAPAVALDGDPGFGAALARAFAELRPTSIDFGVMEHAARVRCIPARFSWSDVGGWNALEEHLPGRADGNVARGRLEAQGASGNLVFCEDPEETVALVGVEGLAVVRTGKTTLVVSRARTEEIKALVQRLDPRLK
jgi:mannose-1-phosphate guanylyltransferase